MVYVTTLFLEDYHDAANALVVLVFVRVVLVGTTGYNRTL
jgi:hypothetical protein